MPARKAAAAKRKAPSAAQSPATSSKKRAIKEKTTTKSLDGAAPPASLLQRWAAGVAAQLVSSTPLDQHAASVGCVEIDVEGAGRAAVEALPPGKLRTELRRDEDATVRALRTQVESLRAKQQEQQEQKQKSPKAGRSKNKKMPGPGFEVDGAAGAASPAGGGGVVPCTVRLYRHARAAASGDTKLLRALAVNPRAPLELLVDAVGASAGRDPSEETLESAVVGMKTLATALAADPKAAVSPPGLTFYAERAAALAAAAAAAVTKRDDTAASKTAADAATAAEACGLMLRILQVASLAVNTTASSAAGSGRRTEGRQADGEGDGESSSSAVMDDPADRLLLPCPPEVPSPLSDVLVSATAAAAGAPAPTVAPPPPARLSIARLLAHYAVTSAVCCCSVAGRGKKGLGAAAFIRSARAIATGRARGGDADSDKSSSSDDDDDEDDEDTNDGSHGYFYSTRTLSQHLSALCAASLAGNEPATLEFLRCVGDAVCAAVAPSEAAATIAYLGRSSGDGGDEAVRASLAPTCSRALARLPHPAAASTPPTASQFLKRAYAFRVVGALNRSAAAAATAAAAASPPPSSSGRNGAVIAVSRRAAAARSGGGGTSANRAPSWNFVGAGAVSPALLEFLERPEAPVAVGKGPASAAVEELVASRRHGGHGGSPAGIVELLRSSSACAPVALSALLLAMERLEGGEEDGGGGDGVGGKTAPAMGGFFLDTGGDGGAGAETVLTRLGSGGVVADMDEEEVASALSDSDGDA